MTVPTHATAVEVPTPMPRTAESGQAAAVDGEAVTPAGANVGRRALKQLGENPLLVLFGTAIIALLVFNLNATNDRITRLEARMDARFAALEADVDGLRKDMDDRFAALEEDMDDLDRRLTTLIDELDRRLTTLIAGLDRKLTALIAALNMTGEIDAALEGRLVRTPPGPGADRAGAGDASG